ncbi:MAG: thiol peroxidase [Prevotellaceae bacterium]|jgi:thiol peroxidase|nr:thiol peroxidase [Prevotellaceae bacterium]
MTRINFKGVPVAIAGDLPKVGDQAPDFKLVTGELAEISLKDFAGKRVILNIFPSIDTGVCATSVRKFNQWASQQANTAVICVSKDLPFAAARFCGAEGLENVITASDFRYNRFGADYGVLMVEGALKGLLARSVIAIDQNGKVTYCELVPEITEEPTYNVE